MRHHVVISGTGRAGTTFLVQLLTRLGLDTGFNSPTSGIYSNCHAGMERDLRDPSAPYIVKSPWMCDYLDEVIRNQQVVIDHAIIPMRDLYSAAESRRNVARNAGLNGLLDHVPGGLWHTAVPEDQEAVLACQLHRLLLALAEHEVPTTLLHFPRIIADAEYLYGKIRFLMQNVDYRTFLESFGHVARPDLVHDFGPAPAGSGR